MSLVRTDAGPANAPNGVVLFMTSASVYKCVSLQSLAARVEPRGRRLTVDMESAGAAGSGAANGSLASDGERLAGKHLGLRLCC